MAYDLTLSGPAYSYIVETEFKMAFLFYSHFFIHIYYVPFFEIIIPAVFTQNWCKYHEILQCPIIIEFGYKNSGNKTVWKQDKKDNLS